MTREEVGERYQIPLHILQKYEQWELRHGKSYEENDVEQMSMMMTLYAIGFSDNEGACSDMPLQLIFIIISINIYNSFNKIFHSNSIVL